MTRGGKREKSGRKKMNEEKKKVTKSFRINPELLLKLEKKFPDFTLSSIIEKALIEYIEKNENKKE